MHVPCREPYASRAEVDTTSQKETVAKLSCLAAVRRIQSPGPTIRHEDPTSFGALISDFFNGSYISISLLFHSAAFRFHCRMPGDALKRVWTGTIPNLLSDGRFCC
jgi:hypothetical protein